MSLVKIVSVPLRGCGFEIGVKLVVNQAQKERFRPLTGMWF